MPGMRRGPWIAGCALGMGLGCLPAPFVCSDNSDCSVSAEGVCEAVGACSYPDDACESGRRYSEFGGDIGGQCVGPSTSTSGTTDTNPDPVTSSGSSSPLTTSSSGASTSESTTLAETSEGSDESSSSTGTVDPTICDGIDCSGRGECAPVNGEPTCACDPGWWMVDLECLEDPCDTEQCYFIDDVGGDDMADGSRETPWQTLERAAMGIADSQPGDHFLFRRGGTFSRAEDVYVNSRDGTPDASIVLGAYGAPEDPAPTLELPTLFVNESSYVTVRDLNIVGSEGPCVRLSRSHHVLVMDNEISACPVRGIRAGDTSAYLTIYRNYIHDVETKAGIFIADTDWSTPEPEFIGSHHWVADNILTRLTEDGIRLTYDSFAADQEVGDAKIVGNEIGDIGYSGIVGVMRFGWAVGNVSVNTGKNTTTNTDYGALVMRGEETVVRGNIAAGAEETLQLTNRSRVLLNTVFQNVQDHSVRVHGNAGVEFTDNVVKAAGGRLVNLTQPDSASSFEDNLYTPDAMGVCTFRVGSSEVAFDSWQSTHGYDAAGECAPTDAIGSVVTDAAPPFDSAFWDALVPTPDWESCDDKGAINCDGELRRATFPRIDGLPVGEGRGWEGPLVIQQKYPL